MSATDPDRLTRLERRVAELETRLTAMGSGVAAGAAPPVLATGAGSVAPVRESTPGWGPPPARRAAPISLSALVGSALSPRLVEAAPQASAWTPLPPKPPAASRSFADLEEQLSSRLLAWVGGIALVLGAMFFLSLAFSRGWIGPEARVLIGMIAGAAALVAGAWLFDRGDRTPATVLAGVGVGTASLALFAASRLYAFIPVETALVGYLVLAVGTAAIALRGNSQAVATFGLLAMTAAPPILGASPNLVTVVYLGATLVGTGLMSFRRSWPWLALLAFLMSAPQAARWFLDEPDTRVAIAGVAAFWAVNALATSGSALAGVRPTVHRASGTLLALNALFAIWAIHDILANPVARSVGLIVLADLHFGLALPLLLRRPTPHPFGALAAGLAVGVLGIGIAIELGGIASPIAHTVLASVVAWVAIHFRDRVAAAWAAAVGSLAVLHFVAVEYPLWSIGRTAPEGWPFFSPETIVTIVMAAVLLTTGVVAWRSLKATPTSAAGPWRWTAELALAAGCLGEIAIFAYAAEFELWADLRVVAWAILAVAAFGVAAVLRRDRLAWLAAAIQGAILIAMGALVALIDVAPLGRLHVDPFRGGEMVPLLNLESLALAALAVALAVAGWVVARWSPALPFSGGNRPWAVGAAAGAAAVVVYLGSIAIVDVFQAQVEPLVASSEIATQAQVALSIAWVLVGGGAFALGLVRGIGLARGFGLALLAVATMKVFLFDLAALDVAYRVLSFIGLGGVLLASSFVAAHFRAPRGQSPA